MVVCARPAKKRARRTTILALPDWSPPMHVWQSPPSVPVREGPVVRTGASLRPRTLPVDATAGRRCVPPVVSLERCRVPPSISDNLAQHRALRTSPTATPSPPAATPPAPCSQSQRSSEGRAQCGITNVGARHERACAPNRHQHSSRWNSCALVARPAFRLRSPQTHCSKVHVGFSRVV
ncbi:hypothetical protein BC628DRAFT_165939 [Trametes gibbosa]|nr:hypothetical protein BC628DRAFT_165939 [Trametes gibbosa]